MISCIQERKGGERYVRDQDPARSDLPFTGGALMQRPLPLIWRKSGMLREPEHAFLLR